MFPNGAALETFAESIPRCQRIRKRIRSYAAGMRARAKADRGMALAMTDRGKRSRLSRWKLRREHWMSRLIAVHVVAGILFVGVGTSDAQESIPRPAVVEARDTLTSTGVLPTGNDSSSLKNDMLEPAVLFRLDCVAGIEGDVGVTVAIAPHVHLDDTNDNIDGRQNADRSPRDASDSARAKAGTARRWFAGAMLRMVEFLAGGLASTGGR